MGNTAKTGQKVVFRIFRVDAKLQRIATELNVFLAITQGQAGSDAQLFTHNIHSGNGLGDGVFHLHPGVHFHKVHFVAGQQKFHGAGVFVAYGFSRPHCQGANVLSLLRRELRAGCNFNQLLVAPLYRTIAFEQVNNVAVTVRQYLHLNVARIHNALFHKHFGRAKGLGGLRNDARVLGCQFLRCVAAANTPAAAARGGFHHDRVANLVGQFQGFLQICKVAVRAGGDGYAGGAHTVASLGFIAHFVHNVGFWADKRHAFLFAQTRKVGVF